MLIWNMAATIAYKNGSWISAEIRKDNGGFFAIGPDISKLPEITAFVTSLGLIPQSTIPDPSINSVVFRFSAIGTNGNIRVFGNTDGIVVVNDLQEIAADLAADLDFVTYFTSQFIISGIPFSIVSGMPILVDNILNGQPGFRFDAGTCAETTMSILNNFTIVAVVSSINSLPPENGIILSINSSGNYADIRQLGHNQIQYNYESTHLACMALDIITSPKAIILRQNVSGGRVDLWSMGGQSVTAPVVGGGIDLLSLDDASDGVSGDFIYIAVYDSALSLVAINQIYTTIATTYGLIIPAAIEAP